MKKNNEITSSAPAAAGGFSVTMLCVMALAIAINVIGGQIALFLHLPVYLDSMGTILAAMLYGPLYGMLPPLAYGLVMGFTLDIYSLYFMPVGMILGFVTGLVARRFRVKGLSLIPCAMLITIPGTIVSSVICAVLFGGITSSGSTVLVQLLKKLCLGLLADLPHRADRAISLVLTLGQCEAEGQGTLLDHLGEKHPHCGGQVEAHLLEDAGSLCTQLLVDACLHYAGRHNNSPCS